MELFGLDISEAAINLAKKHHSTQEIDFRAGSIEQTEYEDGFFDIVTCNASMSYWRNPVQCFNEIYRCLKSQGVAIFTEPQKNIDIDTAIERIRENMKDKSLIRRFLAVNLNKFGLRRGKSVGLKLYAISEIEDLAKQSLFRKNHKVEKISLQNLPIFVKITLFKD
jgi:ubiquinone/menaquinone biosynthesis C-methylase UbiE